MERFDLKNKNILIIILFISIFSVGVISIAFAALSQTLNITSGKVTQNALTWDVGFVAGTYTGTAGGTSSTGRSCGSITATRNTLTVNNTTLSKPGDACHYSIPITNDGDLTAYLQNLIYTAPTSTTCSIIRPAIDDVNGYGSMTCGNIKYYIDEWCASLNTITSSGDETLDFSIDYIGDSLNSSSVSQKNAKITISYTDDYNARLFESSWQC